MDKESMSEQEVSEYENWLEEQDTKFWSDPDEVRKYEEWLAKAHLNGEAEKKVASLEQADPIVLKPLKVGLGSAGLPF